MTPDAEAKLWRFSLTSLLVVGHVAALLVWLNAVHIGPWYAQSCGWPLTYSFRQDAGLPYFSVSKLAANIAIGMSVCLVIGLWVELVRKLTGYHSVTRWQIRFSTVLWWTAMLAACIAWSVEHRKVVELRHENQVLRDMAEPWVIGDSELESQP